jgi:hypothetical protein
MHRLPGGLGAAALVTFTVSGKNAHSKQRPLVTEDPEPIGAGPPLIRGKAPAQFSHVRIVQGLRLVAGNLWAPAVLGVSLRSQLDCRLQSTAACSITLSDSKRSYPRPLSHLLTNQRRTRPHDIGDITAGPTEGPLVVRRSQSVQDFSPCVLRSPPRSRTASNESGLGLGHGRLCESSLLAAK